VSQGFPPLKSQTWAPGSSIAAIPAIAKKRNARTLTLTLLAIMAPLVLAYALIAMDMRTDLSGLKPKRRVMSDGTTLVSWGGTGDGTWGGRRTFRREGYASSVT